MKMVKVIGLVVGLVSLLGVAACADDTGTGFWMKVSKLSVAKDSDFQVIDLDSSLAYNVWYDGQASVSLGEGGAGAYALLTGNGQDTNIWHYYTSNVDAPTTLADWTQFDSLVGPVKALPNSTNDSGTKEVGPITISGVKHVAIGYDITLREFGTKGTAVASGNGTLTVQAVPEPGTILAALSVLAPAGFAFRRKRA